VNGTKNTKEDSKMNPSLFLLLSQACLEQVPLVDEPGMVVWEFNRAYTRQYFGKDGMGSL